MLKKFGCILIAFALCALPFLAGACADAEPAEFTLTFDANGIAADGMPASVTVEAGETVFEPIAPSAAGYVFGGWFYEPACNNAFYFDYDKLAQNRTLYAKWTVAPEEPALSVLTKTALTDPALVKWQGRTEYKADAAVFYHTAAGFEVRFFGTELTAVFTTDNTSGLPGGCAVIAVAVDGEIFPSGRTVALKKASEKITLAENLAGGEHTVRVAKTSEPEDSANSVTELATDGYFLPAPAPAETKILCVGGSGISGHGSTGSPGAGRTTYNSSSLYGFGYLTARMFGADVQFVSGSGWGIKYGFNQSSQTRGQVNLPLAFEYAGIAKNGSLVGEAYDPAGFVPDAVIVNAGGNDYSAYINGLSGSAAAAAETAFKTAVADFCTRLIALYPETVVFWTYTDGAKNGAAAVSAINGLSIAVRSRIVPTVIADVASYGEPAGANNHAGVKTHIRNADILAAAIEPVCGVARVLDNVAGILD